LCVVLLVVVPLKLHAQKLGVVVHSLPDSIDFKMTNYNIPQELLHRFDIGVISSFGYMLPDRIINSFRCGMLNVHPSLLPRYRGAAPIQHAILKGDTVGGVSIITVHPTKIDNGNILLQVPYRFAKHETFASLLVAYGALGGRALVETLKNLPTLSSAVVLQSHLSDTKMVSFKQRLIEIVTNTVTKDLPVIDSLALVPIMAPKLRKQDAQLSFWVDAEQVFRHFRALKGSLVCYCYLDGKRIQILDMFLPPQPSDDYMSMQRISYGKGEMRPGRMTYLQSHRAIKVECLQGFVYLTLLKVEGKSRAVDADEFARG
jgi:methionyl-tRNA formyltransferase